ncbi:MAG: signal peptide peptidase SppA, partial [Schleiferiaceae bacterium]|nr:signal peptide peptidase SppA [Schleiferiaceae bacterium]
STQIGMNQLKRVLKSAQSDDNITALYLNFSGLQAGPATLKEMRQAFTNFKENTEKPIYAYAEVYTQKSLYLASVADSIFIQPNGMIELSGLSANVAYYKNMFQKIGVKPEIIRGSNNKFKSAVEPFIEDSMSYSNRLQLETLLGDLWQEYAGAIADGRGLKIDDIQVLADDFAVQSPKKSVEAGLIDALWYPDEMDEHLRKLVGAETVKDIDFISHETYDLATKTINTSARDKVAVIYAIGDIMGGSGDENTIGSVTTANAIRKARLNDRVKAIVLRVNSPGGSSLASDVIWREMKLAKETKPVIVSMGDYAASGGYYISAPADTILAQTNTITGSIGIFMTLFTAEELIEDKIGIHYDVVKTGEFADILSLNRSLKETEKMKLQNLVDEGYGQFLSLVAEGRSLDSGYVDSIGQGRVWSGQRAMELGLVDLEGGLDDAIAIAAEKAGLEDYKLMELPVLKTGLQKIMSELQMAKAKEDILKDEFGEFYEQWKQVKKVKSWNEPQARMEFELNIN